MKYLVYAIADAERVRQAPLPVGLDEAPLMTVEHGALAALLSPVSEERAATAGLEQAIEYGRVVEQLHRRLPVLPMRYGCFVFRPEQAEEFLGRHAQEFAGALARVAGREEMGIRVLVPPAEAATPGVPAAARAGPAPTGASRLDGRAYLARRRELYAQREHRDEATRQMAERVQAAFAGLYTDCTWEHAAHPEGELLSLAFLVERTQLAAFRQAFLRFQRDGPPTVMCSGPWPPFSFVAGLARPSMAALAELEHLQHQKG